MDIETSCTGCGERLKVPAEHVGKSARCPVCQTIYTVPAVDATATSTLSTPVSLASAAGTPSAPVAPDPLWFLKTPEGPIYGPVTRSALESWVRDGRVTHDCHVRPESESDWRSAEAEFPVLRPGTSKRLTTASGASPELIGPPMFALPHRGPLILVLGILGLVVWCPILSVMAWVMGTNDLREMRAGQRDPMGKSLTHAGQVLGLALSMIWILAAVITAGVIVFIAAIG